MICLGVAPRAVDAVGLCRQLTLGVVGVGMADAGRPTLLQRQDIAHVVIGQGAGIEVRRGIGGLASCISPAGRAEALPDLDDLQEKLWLLRGSGINHRTGRLT